MSCSVPTPGRKTQAEYDQVRQDLVALCSKKVAIFDGGAGTLLQALKLTEEDMRGAQFADHSKLLKGNYDVLNLTNPQHIFNLHKRYLDAGADVIETNTFSSSVLCQAEYGLEKQIHSLNVEGARVALSAAKMAMDADPQHRRRFVAGSMGPTNKSASMPQTNGGLEWKDFVAAYKDQIRGLIDGGVDILLVETVFDTLNCKAALCAIDELVEDEGYPRPPVWISVTLSDASGRTLSGQTPEAFWISVAHSKPMFFGFNCSLGVEAMGKHVRDISPVAQGAFLAFYPNAGLPNELGKYMDDPDHMAHKVADLAREGLINVIGGCCGTTPDHIAAISKAVAGIPPRKIPPVDHSVLKVCGLEALHIKNGASNFVNIGEQCNVAGSRTFLNRIKAGKFEEAAKLAKAQVEGGAHLIDVNMDDAMLDAPSAMKEFLKVCGSDPSISKTPFVVDSSRLNALEAGLGCVQGKCIVNSISLKEGEEAFLRAARVCRKFGAAIIVMAFDEEGQAVTKEHKVRVCERAYKLLTEKLQIPGEDIIFDLNVLMIGSGMSEHNNYAVNFIEATREIKQKMPLARISGGVSNLSFAFRPNEVVRTAMHSAFLLHAIEAGMDMGIVNAAKLIPYTSLPADLRQLAEDVVMNKSPEAGDKLGEYAKHHSAASQPGTASTEQQQKEKWLKMPVSDRLKQRIVDGSTDGLSDDLAEATVAGPHTAVPLLEGPLMAGMAQVGELFGSGKMFLPQVLRSARVMKEAVAFLRPLMEKAKSSSQKGPVMVLATVKGDVHDIGKNIVGVVLECAAGVEVVDLGTMVICDTIADAVVKHNAAALGLSALITPSLDEMASVIRELERRGITIPVFVGGAATSALHTAVRLAPLRAATGGLVIHALDASRTPALVSSILDPATSKDFAEEVRAEQEELRKRYNATSKTLAANTISLTEARTHAPSSPSSAAAVVAPKPAFLGTRTIEYPLENLVDAIDWKMFFALYGIQGTFPNKLYPRVLNDAVAGPHAKKLLEEAKQMLGELVKGKLLQARGIVGIYPARGNQEDIDVFEDEACTKKLATFHGLRQQLVSEDPAVASKTPLLALGDMVEKHVAVFAVSAGFGMEALIQKYRAEGKPDKLVMVEALASRLAEAAAQKLHEDVRTTYWPCDVAVTPSVRPAFGYPHQPDHTEKRTCWTLMDVKEKVGITLTDSCMMFPQASVSGLVLQAANARYFSLGNIGQDQVQAYADRKGITLKEAQSVLNTCAN